jgi:hypothetical protein
MKLSLKMKSEITNVRNSRLSIKSLRFCFGFWSVTRLVSRSSQESGTFDPNSKWFTSHKGFERTGKPWEDICREQSNLTMYWEQQTENILLRRSRPFIWKLSPIKSLSESIPLFIWEKRQPSRVCQIRALRNALKSRLHTDLKWISDSVKESSISTMYVIEIWFHWHTLVSYFWQSEVQTTICSTIPQHRYEGNRREEKESQVK